MSMLFEVFVLFYFIFLGANFQFEWHELYAVSTTKNETKQEKIIIKFNFWYENKGEYQKKKKKKKKTNKQANEEQTKKLIFVTPTRTARGVQRYETVFLNLLGLVTCGIPACDCHMTSFSDK